MGNHGNHNGGTSPFISFAACDTHTIQLGSFLLLTFDFPLPESNVPSFSSDLGQSFFTVCVWKVRGDDFCEITDLSVYNIKSVSDSNKTLNQIVCRRTCQTQPIRKRQLINHRRSNLTGVFFYWQRCKQSCRRASVLLSKCFGFFLEPSLLCILN